MSKIIFNYDGKDVVIQCSFDEKMKDIYQKYCSKQYIDITKVYFVYNGNIIDEETICNKIINEEDRNRNAMNILVNDNDDETIIKKILFNQKKLYVLNVKKMH